MVQVIFGEYIGEYIYIYTYRERDRQIDKIYIEI